MKRKNNIYHCRYCKVLVNSNKDWKILRFWENDIMNNINVCFNKIKNTLEESKCY